MAIQTLVDHPSTLERQLVQFIQHMTQQRGDFTLAMLVPSEASLSDKWNFVLSAGWIDNDGLTPAIPALTSALQKHLSRVNAKKLERISVLATNDHLVSDLTATLRIAPGQVYLLQNYPLATRGISEARIFVAQRITEAGYRQHQPVHTRA